MWPSSSRDAAIDVPEALVKLKGLLGERQHWCDEDPRGHCSFKEVSASVLQSNAEFKECTQKMYRLREYGLILDPVPARGGVLHVA